MLRCQGDGHPTHDMRVPFRQETRRGEMRGMQVTPSLTYNGCHARRVPTEPHSSVDNFGVPSRSAVSRHDSSLSALPLGRLVDLDALQQRKQLCCGNHIARPALIVGCYRSPKHFLRFGLLKQALCHICQNTILASVKAAIAAPAASSLAVVLLAIALLPAESWQSSIYWASDAVLLVIN